MSNGYHKLFDLGKMDFGATIPEPRPSTPHNNILDLTARVCDTNVDWRQEATTVPKDVEKQRVEPPETDLSQEQLPPRIVQNGDQFRLFTESIRGYPLPPLLFKMRGAPMSGAAAAGLLRTNRGRRKGEKLEEEVGSRRH